MSKLRLTALTGIMLAATTSTGAAQSLQDLKTPKSPLQLKATGSFFVGGERVAQTTTQLGLGAAGHVTINQMYVQYMIPTGKTNIPVVMVHGGTLSGKGYETQPDGRMGWAEYFVRKGHPVYVPDQVLRARSGFNQAPFNDARAGVVPPSAIPPIIRLSEEESWLLFRFGASVGVPYGDSQFPIDHLDEFAKQGIPDISSGSLNWKPLSDLALQLKGAVVMGHSESGQYPLEAALVNPRGTKGLIVMEPGDCKATVYTDSQIATLAKVPIMVLFGDHLDTPATIVNWPASKADCDAFVNRVNRARGNATMVHLPEVGIHGNSHMIMNDKNSDQVADLILSWIHKNVSKDKTADLGHDCGPNHDEICY